LRIKHKYPSSQYPLNKKTSEPLKSRAVIAGVREGSHRIYKKGNKRIILPFHPGRILHPKIVKQGIKRVED